MITPKAIAQGHQMAQISHCHFYQILPNFTQKTASALVSSPTGARRDKFTQREGKSHE